MKVLFLISAIVSLASAGVGPFVIIPSASTTLLRSPQRDSAIVQSERLGGNFAYAIAEGQSFQTVSPLIHGNLRAIDNLGVSYAINPFPILTGPAFLLPQPTSEEEQREQQKHRDSLQKQRDELQEALNRQREEDERQLQEQIDQQNLLNQQAIEQQKQLIELQQQWQHDQQNLVGPSFITLPVAIAPTIPANDNNNNNNNNNNDNINNNDNQSDADKTIITDDAVVVENTALTKEQVADDENAQAEDQPNEEQSDRQTEITSDDNH